MINPNQKGLIYYGTDIKYLENLDKNGLDRPRVRDEQYISVSISGYASEVPCDHEDLRELARVFSNGVQAADYTDGRLTYKEGYVYTLTCLHGFGPNPNKYYPGFYGFIENRRTINTVTAVISSEAEKYLITPDKGRTNEYLSLALHSFLREINPDLIVGWIVHREKAAEILTNMENGTLTQRALWIIEDADLFKPFEYDFTNRAKYAVYPSDINRYLNRLDEKYARYDEIYTPCFEHLKSVLVDVTRGSIDWEKEIPAIHKDLLAWYQLNESRIIWDESTWRFRLAGFLNE